MSWSLLIFMTNLKICLILCDWYMWLEVNFLLRASYMESKTAVSQ